MIFVSAFVRRVVFCSLPLQRELQLGHMTRDTFNVQTTEVLVALKQLQEPVRF